MGKVSFSNSFDVFFFGFGGFFLSVFPVGGFYSISEKEKLLIALKQDHTLALSDLLKLQLSV